ncbi:putative quinol monooxygenase [Oscillospiraceae bacterium MB08-C2-2]|nr:putative quinol monooxygenase [Oscillospiraceae bacterium MB08-C2-2]
MIKVTAEFVLKAGAYEKAISIANELIKLTRLEKGCVAYDLAKSNDDENVLVMFETWESQAALQKHSASAHFAALVPEFAALCSVAPAIKTFTQVI